MPSRDSRHPSLASVIWWQHPQTAPVFSTLMVITLATFIRLRYDKLAWGATGRPKLSRHGGGEMLARSETLGRFRQPGLNAGLRFLIG